LILPRFREPTAGDKYDSRGTEDDDDSAFVKLIETKFVTDDEIVVKQSTFSLEVKKWAHEEQLNDFVNQWFLLF
jgi:hypothetical protein